MENKESFFDSIKTYGPGLYLILVFWGLVHEFIYFKLFNIDITSYIDISELLLLLYDDALLLCVFLVVGIIYFFMMQAFVEVGTFIINRFRKKDKQLTASRFAYTLLAIIVFYSFVGFYARDHRNDRPRWFNIWDSLGASFNISNNGHV